MALFIKLYNYVLWLIWSFRKLRSRFDDTVVKFVETGFSEGIGFVERYAFRRRWILFWSGATKAWIRSDASYSKYLSKRRSYFKSDRYKSYNWQVGIRLNRITCFRVAVRSLDNPSWTFAVQTNHTQKRYPPNRSTSLKLTNEKIARQYITLTASLKSD